MNAQKIKEVYRKKTDEEILVVSRKDLFPNGTINGLEKVDFNEQEKIIKKSAIFMWRSKAEVDPNFKQIIPYLIFSHDDKFFVMQRSASSSEIRLQNKYSLGIGGHIIKEDIENKGIDKWSEREFNEEIEYSGSFKMEFLGVLNDESNFVGSVHTGLVFLLRGDSSNIKVRSELKSGSLMTLEECNSYYNSMEAWSQIVFKTLFAGQPVAS